MSEFLDGLIGGLFAHHHYVTMTRYGKSPEILQSNKGMALMAVSSGFIVSVRNYWFMVTAGHVLEGIEEERQKGIELSTFRIWDGWHIDAKDRHHIPFDYDKAQKLRLYDEPSGLDYGLIHLQTYYVNLLKANEIVPISEDQYSKDWPDKFNGFVMIGTPNTTVSLQRHVGTSTKIKQSVVTLKLVPEKDPPAVLKKSFPRFYARIDVPEDATGWQEIKGNIEGMSGGPVIAVRRDESGLKYWVMGIQSGWSEQRRVIAACYAQRFFQFVGEAIDAAGELNLGD